MTRLTSLTRLFKINCHHLNLRSFLLKKEKMSSLTDKAGTDYKQLGLLTILEKNPKRFERIRFLSDLFETNGHEVRIAGGAVRDILRNVEPHDIDFATTARPEESLSILGKHEDLLRIIVTAAGQKHGTVAVKFKETDLDLKRIKLDNADQQENSNKAPDKPEYDDESPFEITTLRCDTFTDGRHAEVEFVNDWRIDAERRDLTINAMFLTLKDGKLVDYFGGEQDLKDGKVRFVGSADSRIKEDYLRILRFFRFWSRYGLNNRPDEETLTTIRNNLGGLNIISGERIWQETKKILSYLPCLGVVSLMLELKLYESLGISGNEVADHKAYIETVLNELKQVELNIENYSKDILNPRLRGEQIVSSSDKRIKDLLPVILFATFIRSQNMCLEAHKRIKFSNLERDCISFIVENRAKKNVSLDGLKYLLATIHVPERPATLTRVKAFLIYNGQFDFLKEIEDWPIPNFPMNGTIVAQELKKRNLKGLKVKEILEALKEEWAHSDYTLEREQLEQMMFEKLNNHVA